MITHALLMNDLVLGVEVWNNDEYVEGSEMSTSNIVTMSIVNGKAV